MKELPMENKTPHKAGCDSQELELLANAYFCKKCRRRVGFLPKEQAKKRIEDALKRDIGGLNDL